MRYLNLEEVLALHRMVISQSGGINGTRDIHALESSVAQPYLTFGGENLYPTLVEKAAALGFSLVMNHAFLDGNKRIGHAAMETFLILNGYEIRATVDEQETIILRLAAGELDRAAFADWLGARVSNLRGSREGN